MEFVIFLLVGVGLIVIFFSRPAATSRSDRAQHEPPFQGVKNLDAIRVSSAHCSSTATIPDGEACYHQAFLRVASQLEGPIEPLAAALPELTEYYLSGGGDWKRHVMTVAQAWPDTLRWPACEALLRERAVQERQDYLEEIGGYDVFDFLSGMKVAGLRALHARYAPAEKLLARSKKSDIVKAFATDLSEEAKARLLSEFQDAALRDFDESAEQIEWERASMFVRYLSRAAGNLRHMAQAREIAEYRPMWKFVSGEDVTAECKARDGKCFRFDDPLWAQILPCAHPECTCYCAAVAPKDR